jgi:heat shock protein HslJ
MLASVIYVPGVDSTRERERMRILLLLASLAALTASACTATDRSRLESADAPAMQAPTAHLFDAGEWQLVELGGQPVAADGAGRAPSLQFDREQRRVAGFSGCNRFGGTFELGAGDTLRLRQMFSTKMACLGENVEPQFLRMLEQVERWRIEENQLLLHGSTGADPLARFRRVEPAGS